MTSSTEEHTEDPTTERLLELVARGFQMLPPQRDGAGELVALMYVRHQSDVVDLVVLHSEDDARAVRVPENEDPVRPSRILWQRAGAAADVLGAVLDLPERSLLAANVTDQGGNIGGAARLHLPGF